MAVPKEYRWRHRMATNTSVNEWEDFESESPRGRGSARTRAPKREDWQKERTEEKAPAPPPPVPDGFEPSFLDIGSAIACVAEKYEDRPRYTDLENERLLQVALGEIPLCAHSARKMWLVLGHA